MTLIISTPNDDNNDAFGFNSQYQFGYYEAVNRPHRPLQLDALTWMSLSATDLTPKASFNILTPQEIGHRLWTTYRLLDKPELRGGTTATTVVYDGSGSLITATLADANSFLVVYDHIGTPLEVVRLNHRSHTPTDSDEITRIEQNKGFILNGRVNGCINITRAIGDNDLKSVGVCSEADIDICNLQLLQEKYAALGILLSGFQVINACDGFTDPAGHNVAKELQEYYVLDALQKITFPGTLPEDELAKLLVSHAKTGGSTDNISVSIHTLKVGRRMLMGVYDSHGFAEAACYVAENIGSIFKQQCKLTTSEYQSQPLSVQNNLTNYQRDNAIAESEKQVSTVSSASPAKPLRRANAMIAYSPVFTAVSDEQQAKKARVEITNDKTNPNSSL